MIRRATADDADAVLAVHRASRAAAYAHLGPPGAAAGHSTVQSWRASLERADHAWVAERDGAVVAFACVEGDKLAGLYVLPSEQGAGLGGALHDLAVDHGARALWVYAEHRAARSFYECRGWIAEPGTEHVDPGWALQRPALRYRRP